MKTILCYGDSNTYGYDPSTGFRYPADVRWTGVLKRLLGPDYTLIEEGCNGRTTVFDDPLEGWKNGLDYLKPCLNSHHPTPQCPHTHIPHLPPLLYFFSIAIITI